MNRATTVFFCIAVLAITAILFLPLAMAQDGETLYINQCAKCHGNDGRGKTNAAQKMKVIDLRSEYVQKQSDDELFSSIAHGVHHKDYPHAFAHRGLSDMQIMKLVAHIRQFPKAK
jgi:cytochrome c553